MIAFVRDCMVCQKNIFASTISLLGLKLSILVYCPPLTRFSNKKVFWITRYNFVASFFCLILNHSSNSTGFLHSLKNRVSRGLPVIVLSILYAFTIGISRIVVKVSLGAKDPWRWFEIRFGIKEGSIYFRKHSSRIVISSLNFSIQMFILCIFIQNQYDINFVSQTCLNLFRFNMVWIVKIYVILKQVTYLFRFKMTWNVTIETMGKFCNSLIKCIWKMTSWF